MKNWGMIKRWLPLLAIPLFLCRPAFSTTVADCRQAILELAKEGPGGDWNVRDRLVQLMRDRNLTDLVYSKCYRCSNCQLENPTMNEDGKTAHCESCKKAFDNDHEMHEVSMQDGTVVVHVRGINYDDGKALAMHAPWFCPFCKKKNVYEADVCARPGCNHTREEGNREVVKIGAEREVVEVDTNSRGYVVDTKEDARRAREQREKDRRDQAEEEPVVDNQPAQEKSRWNRLNRNRIVGATAALTLGLGSIWYGIQDPPPPVLPTAQVVSAQVDSVYWEKRVLVQEFDGKNWKPLKPFIAKGDHTVKPHLPPELLPEYSTNPKKYQIEIIPYYSVLITNPGTVPMEREISREEFHNWSPGDKVSLTVLPDGTPLHIRREAK